MFLLKPSPQLNNAVGATLGRALKESKVIIHSVTTNINHMEIIFSIDKDQLDHASDFLRNFAGLLARELNRLYDRKGHFWSGRARVEEITGDNKAEKLLGYGACNVVKDGLVEHAKDWTGFSTMAALERGEKLVFKYVDRTLWWKHGADHKEVDPSKYTKTTSVELHPLPAWASLDEEERRGRFKQVIHVHEQLAKDERRAEGIAEVKGMARIEKLSPFDKPSRPRQRSPQPLCHADTFEEYKNLQEEYEKTVKKHRIASAAYRAGHLDVEFPPGTFRPPLVRVFKQAA